METTTANKPGGHPPLQSGLFLFNPFALLPGILSETNQTKHSQLISGENACKRLGGICWKLSSLPFYSELNADFPRDEAAYV
jgi:hypothetical protein